METTCHRTKSFDTQISSHYSFECVHELLVGGCITEWIDWTVEIADEVGEHVDVDIDAGWTKAEKNLTVISWFTLKPLLYLS